MVKLVRTTNDKKNVVFILGDIFLKEDTRF
jgi:hypothetical protein